MSLDSVFVFPKKSMVSMVNYGDAVRKTAGILSILTLEVVLATLVGWLPWSGVAGVPAGPHEQPMRADESCCGPAEDLLLAAEGGC